MTAIPKEEWKPIVGFPAYEVSNLGRVISRHRRIPRQLAATPNDKGYPMVTLARGDGFRRNRPVHQLVAEAFLGERPDGLDIRHVNGDKTDNRDINLRYGTRRDNIYDQVAHGTHSRANKTHCPSGHAYDAANTREYRGARFCRACQRQRSADYERRRMAKVALPADEAARQLAAAAAR